MDFFEIVYDFNFILQLLVVIASLIIIFHKFEKTKKSILQIVIAVVSLFVLGTLLNWGLFELSHVVVILRGINFPISWLILIFCYLAFVKSPMINRVLMGGTLFVTVYAAINISRFFLASLSSGWEFATDFIYVFVILYSIVLRKLSLKEYTDLPSQSVVMMLVITALLSVVLMGSESYSVLSGVFLDSWRDCIILLTCYFVSICSYLMLYFYATARKRIVDLQVENKLLEADRERVESFENIVEEYHQIKHDIANQMNVMKILLEKEDYVELNNYFNSMYSNFVNTNIYDFIDCGNSLINSVVNMEMLKAKHNNIELKVNINVAQELPFESSDICRILVNLIDNAIEALLRTDEKNKQVLCSILTHGEYLYIGVQNKISEDSIPEKVLKLNTEKEDQVNHGFGHRIVKKIANKYGGHVNYSIEGLEFFAEVMLYIKDTKEGTHNE